MHQQVMGARARRRQHGDRQHALRLDDGKRDVRHDGEHLLGHHRAVGVAGDDVPVADRPVVELDGEMGEAGITYLRAVKVQVN